MTIDLKTAAAYIRVSTDNQTELSPDSQIKLVKEYAKKNGYIIPNEYIYRDDGISGRYADKRPQFNKMIATAKQKPTPFSAVLLWKFSRFARNQEESIFYKSMLRRNNIEIISISEPIIDGPFGTLIERIIEWSDEYYSIRLSGEVKRGMTEKVERGGAVSIPSFGYSIENKNYIINPETAPIVKKIFSDFLNGVGSFTISRNLNALGIKTSKGNKWEKRTVDYVLQNPVYTGKIRWNPKRRTRRNYDDPDIMIVDGQHEPIIDNETFNKVQQMIAEIKKQHKKYAHQKVNEEYMVHGLVKCSNCGKSLCMAVKGASLQCVGYMHGKCSTSHSISIKKINSAVIEGIEQAFKNGYFNLTVRNNNNYKGPETELDIEALVKKESLKLSRIKEAYEDGVYTLSEYKESKSLVEEKIKMLRSQKTQPQSDKKSLCKKLIEKNKDSIAFLKNPNADEAEKNKILSSFIDKIIFNRKNSSIELFFYM